MPRDPNCSVVYTPENSPVADAPGVGLGVADVPEMLMPDRLSSRAMVTGPAMPSADS